MESETLIGSTVVLSAFAGACVLLLLYIVRTLNGEQKHNASTSSTGARNASNKHEHASNENKRKEPANLKNKKKTGDSRWTGRHDRQTYTHPLLYATMKGHSDQVLDADFSSNQKYLVTCSEDRTVMLWDVKDLAQKDRKSLRINIDFDHATFVKWSPDSKAFIVQKFNGNNVDVYKVEKKKDGFFGSATKALVFPKVHEEDVIGLEIANNGKFIMTCSNTTDMIIWDLRGQELARVDTYLMNTYCAKISPCSRFVVASGFAPDVKVWEVVFAKTGDFQEVKRVFELTGHSSGIHDVAFDVDTSHIATVSKDGTWKLFDTKIDYKRGESPHLKITGKYDQASHGAKIALSPDAEVVAISAGSTLYLYSTSTAKLDLTIEDIYEGDITTLAFDASGKYVVVSGDKYVRVFHNVTGHRCNIRNSKEKLKQNQTSATRERLEKIVRDSETFLNDLTSKQ